MVDSTALGKAQACPFLAFRRYLYLEPEGPRGGVQAVRVEDKILPAQVELWRPVAEGPGGEAGSSVRHQVQGQVARTCRGAGRRQKFSVSVKTIFFFLLGLFIDGKQLNHKV